MERKYLKDLIEWNEDPFRKPLMIWGARQVGKSYLVEELFAKVYYKGRYLKLDLSNETDFVEFAEKNSNLSKVLEYIELHYNFKPDKDHLLFFDEAQECPSIVKMMKHFCEIRRDIPLIVSGSLVRLRIHRDSKMTNKGFLFPVGKINQLYLYPLTFDEFLRSYSHAKYDYLKKHYETNEEIDPVIHKEMMDVFLTYMFVGGMPEAVATFIASGTDKIEAYQKVSKKIGEIYADYLADMGLYQTSTESIVRSRLIYGDIYRQLNKENKNFKVSLAVEGAKNRDLVNPFFWLTTANVMLQSWCLKEKVTLPLTRDEDSLFRLYLSDVGMFTYQSGLSYRGFLVDKENSLSGIYYENYIATELAARGIGLFYWKGKRDSEIEFVLGHNGVAVPLDAKKTRGNLHSLNEFRSHNKKGLAVKVSANQYGFDKEQMLLTLPFYYVPFFLDDLQKGARTEWGQPANM